ncbi:MAG: phage replisome organizer N-terminal domain-containing protein [Clostridium sp.]|nr:phage replisome organizer N-terminal domain-containing protein [Clostridium sp.]
MATGKRYYWIKLKESFMTSDAVDFLMGQPDGANYVVLYQMLCLKTINTDGKLERHIGEVIIPYDEAKIQRDTKWFSIDTVRVALNLYKALGLVYVDKDGALCLTDHENLVGSETDWAEKRRRQRSDLPVPSLPSGDNVPSNVPQNVPIDIENRDKEIDIRDKSEEIEKEEGTLSDESVCRPEDVRQVVDAWQTLGIQKLRKIPDSKTNAGKMLRARIRDYGIGSVLEAIEIVRASDFLMGRVKEFQITFDWFVRPNNFLNIVNGKYDNRDKPEQTTRHGREMQQTYNTIERWAEQHANDSETV